MKPINLLGNKNITDDIVYVCLNILLIDQWIDPTVLQSYTHTPLTSKEQQKKPRQLLGGFWRYGSSRES